MSDIRNENDDLTSSRDLGLAVSGVEGITYQILRPRADVPLFKCRGCETPTYLADMNEAMQCEACGPVDLDPEDFAPSESELRRDEGFYT